MKTLVGLLILTLLASPMAFSATVQTDFSSVSGDQEAAYGRSSAQADSRLTENEKRSRARVFIKQVFGEEDPATPVRNSELGQSHTSN